MNTKILKLIATEKLGTVEIAKRLKKSNSYISNHKKELERSGLIFKLKNKHRATPKGFKSLGMEVVLYGEEKLEIGNTETEKVNDRRMTILGYFTFEKFSVKQVAKILKLIEMTVYRDITVLRYRGYMDNNTVTDNGIFKLNSYDGNYGRGRIKATK